MTHLRLHAKFPVGTEVSAYPAGNTDSWSPRRAGVRGRPRSKPPSEPIATEVMTEHGVSFDTLPPGRYFFAAEIDDEWRIVMGHARSGA